ncbi:MAG TPA: hypothetical protein PKV98_16320 [Burkholderiaceae bacterium]|nr:hypothetical protein [Burkholderiaceae bacterium]
MTARARRAADAASGPEWRGDLTVPVFRKLLPEDMLRQDFACRVVRRLIDVEARIAVISDRGRPALVDCREPLYEMLARDHEIVGVYKCGARVPEIIDDLKAAGL